MNSHPRIVQEKESGKFYIQIFNGLFWVIPLQILNQRNEFITVEDARARLNKVSNWGMEKYTVYEQYS